MTDWNAWSQIIDAAQDPQRRDVVQKFLAQIELSAEIPAALDEKFLAPRRPAEATGDQCAYLLCNLGFAALVTGSRGSAAFAMACGRIAGRLAPDMPDLMLRRLFLAAKGALVIAVLTDQPHVSWDDVAEQCAAYLCAIEQSLETLPAESIEGNAMAAYSFAGRALSQMASFRAIEYYAREVASLVSAALRLERRLPSTLTTRIWSTVMPGTDARGAFREVGAAAERVLQVGEESTSHARKGLEYIDEILSQPADSTSPRSGQLMLIRAELLLLSGRQTDAGNMAKSLLGSSDTASRYRATAIQAKLHLQSGDPQSAVELLAQASPTSAQASDAWQADWTAGADEGHWTHRPDAYPRFDDIRQVWGLEAIAAAKLTDATECLGAVDRFGGFLADSFLQDRQQWADRLCRSSNRRPRMRDGISGQRQARAGEPLAVLEDIFDELGEGTALLQIARTEDGILSIAIRRRDGNIRFSLAPQTGDATRLKNANKSWSRAHFDATRHHAGNSDSEADCAGAFSGLLDEVGRIWGDVLQDLLEDDVTQLILIGDDFVDIPLHAARTGIGDERWIDRVPVTYVPSLATLRACTRPTSVAASQRKGTAFRCLADYKLHSANINALAATLGSDPTQLIFPVSASAREVADASQVLHVVARLDHDARMPFDSVLRAGEHNTSLAEVFAGLDLPHCEVVSSFSCESALPSMLRAPGLDLAVIFLAAGARDVLASSWQTGSELASEMTQTFFESWVAGQSPARAFQHALLDVRSERSSLPDYYWAGMRLVGAP